MIKMASSFQLTILLSSSLKKSFMSSTDAQEGGKDEQESHHYQRDPLDIIQISFYKYIWISCFLEDHPHLPNADDIPISLRSASSYVFSRLQPLSMAERNIQKKENRIFL